MKRKLWTFLLVMFSLCTFAQDDNASLLYQYLGTKPNYLLERYVNDSVSQVALSSEADYLETINNLTQFFANNEKKCITDIATRDLIAFQKDVKEYHKNNLIKGLAIGAAAVAATGLAVAQGISNHKKAEAERKAQQEEQFNATMAKSRQLEAEEASKRKRLQAEYDQAIGRKDSYSSQQVSTANSSPKAVTSDPYKNIQIHQQQQQQQRNNVTSSFGTSNVNSVGHKADGLLISGNSRRNVTLMLSNSGNDVVGIYTGNPTNSSIGSGWELVSGRGAYSTDYNTDRELAEYYNSKTNYNGSTIYFNSPNRKRNAPSGGQWGQSGHKAVGVKVSNGQMQQVQLWLSDDNTKIIGIYTGGLTNNSLGAGWESLPSTQGSRTSYNIDGKLAELYNYKVSIPGPNNVTIYY